MTMQDVYVQFTTDLFNLGVSHVSNAISDDSTPCAILLMNAHASPSAILEYLRGSFIIDDWYEDRGPDLGRFLVVLGLEYRNG